MLEAPECHKTVEFLKSNMIGSKITAIDIVDGNYINQYPEGYADVCTILSKNNLFVDNISYNGNLIITELSYQTKSKGNIVIYILHHICHHSKWTLQPQDNSKWNITLDNGKTCWFGSDNDASKIRFTKSIKIVNCQKARFGVDILKPEFTLKKFKKILNNNSKLNIVLFLTSPSILAGICSNMKSQILYNSLISPLRNIEDLKQCEILKLYQTIRVIGGLLSNNVKLNDEEYLSKNMDIHSDPKIVKIKTIDGDISYWNPHIQV